MKYKVGDPVKIVANKAHSMNKIGDIGIIDQVMEQGYKVKVEGGVNLVNWQLESDLELITPMLKYRVNDTVKIVARKYVSNNMIGDIGVIVEVDTYHDLTYKVKVDNRRTGAIWQHETDLELVEVIDTRFKIDDTVNIIPSECDLIRKVGYGGKITATKNGEYLIDIKANGNSINCWQKEENLELIVPATTYTREDLFKAYQLGISQSTEFNKIFPKN